MCSFQSRVSGFTLIELMIVLAIAGVLMGFVGPLAIDAVDKAQAKQERLSINNWLAKISMRANATGETYTLNFAGKSATLAKQGNEGQTIVVSKTFEFNFFPPQQLTYTKKGFVSPETLIVNYRTKQESIDVGELVNIRYRVE